MRRWHAEVVRAVIHRVTLIPGDGVGPELVEAAVTVLAASGVSLRFELRQAGAEMLEKHGTALPDDVLDSIRSTGVALKGPVTTPIGTGFRSVNVALRKELDLYACIRPCKWYPGVRTSGQKPDRNDPTAVGTSQVADAVIQKLEAMRVRA